MAVKSLLTALMTLLVYFFTISLGNGSVYSWIYGLFLIGIFAAIMYTGKVHTYRRVFQFVFALLFTVAFIGNLYDERGSMAMTANTFTESEVPFCHLVIPLVVIPYVLTQTVVFPARILGHYASIISLLVIWFVATITIGRGWCSWACFYGGIEDGFSGMRKKPLVKTVAKNREIRAFHFAVLVFLILMTLAFMSSIYCQWFCPFKLITEFPQLVDIPTLIGTFVFMSLFFLMVVILPLLTKKRTQCSMLCPFGAMQSLLDKMSMYRVVIDTERCTGCMKCAEVCPFFAIDRETILENKGHPEITCAKCGACVDVCPQQAIRFDFSLTKHFREKNPEKAFLDGPGRLTKILREFIEPKYFFVFSAFTFGVVISSGLAVNGLQRIAEALISAINLGGV